MPRLTKEALSKFIGTNCKRQLRLYLSPDNRTFAAERQADHMPPPQPPRPGLRQITQAGEEWGAAKVAELARTFGRSAIIGQPALNQRGETRYKEIDLGMVIRQASPWQFLVEAQFTVGQAFETALRIQTYRQTFGLDYASVRPDLILVLPPGSRVNVVLPDGDVRRLADNDNRLQLKVIDVKLTAEPSPPYFAEVAYYAMTLAGWLLDQELDGQFVVVSDGAVWPGSHDASNLTVVDRRIRSAGGIPTPEELFAAFENDLESVPFEPFAFRLQRFFQDELPEVLQSSWRDLPYHVDNRCRSCEYLGYPWRDRDGNLTSHPNHCMPLAEQAGHLSRIAFVTRGASSALKEGGVPDVATLATRTAIDPVFDVHSELRATRTVVSGRAISLLNQVSAIPVSAGTSAVMPRWTDLRVYLSVDFDLGSAITLAIGIDAHWLEPSPPPPGTEAAQRQKKAWSNVFVVDQKDVDVERRELLAFLDKINEILTWSQTANGDTTVQFFLWDDLQYQHLTRIISRHLESVLVQRSIQHLAWLFPPPEILPNPALSTRSSPLTIVRDAVRALLAVPVAHYYSLLGVARVYYAASTPPQFTEFRVPSLFEDALSDQIPSERAHEIWARTTQPRYWQDQIRELDRTVRTRLRALQTVVRRLTDDLGSTLDQTAPPINKIAEPKYAGGVSSDGQLWYAFARLDEAMADLDVQLKRARPPHEREARFESARLQRRLDPNEAAQALAVRGLSSQLGRMVYFVSPTSREVKLRDGDFDVALSPEQGAGVLNRRPIQLVKFTWLETPLSSGVLRNTLMSDVLAVTVAAFDRDAGIIVLDANRRFFWTNPTGRLVSMFEALEDLGILDFSGNTILDPTHHDYFTKRLLDTLKAIGNPPVALRNQTVLQAIGQTNRRGALKTALVPAADVLWTARQTSETPVTRELAPVRSILQLPDRNLNQTQWLAWETALTRRLQLIWGPPGTGKSRTIQSIVLAAALHASQSDQPIRILISAFTYAAMDNVLLEVFRELCTLLPSIVPDGVARLRSNFSRPNDQVPPEIDVALDRWNPSPRVSRLGDRLQRGVETSIVGGPPQQIYNLLSSATGSSQAHVFDLIVIDEAAQMDVAHATLVLARLAVGGSVVLAGDPLQLAPIHHAEPPLGLENRVGSIYDYCASGQSVAPIMLDENYRSNSTLVNFSRSAGYGEELRSYSPDLRLALASPLPQSAPSDWPPSLLWCPDWPSLLDPAAPAVCFVYSDGRSSQANQFEADAVACLVWLLAGRLSDQLANERDPAVNGKIRRLTHRPYDTEKFWQRGVGVVTPHRAQESLVITRLREIFPSVDPSLIRGAVDTVERFQGQQRDVIIASFALGDPDAISREDEFLLGLNRFNVLASRARAKLVVLLSQELVDHLSADLEVLRGSRLLKIYAESFCRMRRAATLGYIADGKPRHVIGSLRSR